MPARKRHKPGGAEPDLGTRSGRKVAQRSAAQIFAERREAEREEQRQAARARRQAQEREARRRQLTQAKDLAAARLKEVRRRAAPGSARVEAEAAYRAALEALLRDEQGLPPLADEAPGVVAGAPRDLEDVAAGDAEDETAAEA